MTDPLALIDLRSQLTETERDVQDAVATLVEERVRPSGTGSAPAPSPGT